GGYEFTDFEWYKNGNLIGRDQYYSAGDHTDQLLDPDAYYYVKMKTINGDVLQTCPMQPVLSHDYSIQLTPNPIPKGKRMLRITPRMPSYMLNELRYTVYSLNGSVVMKSSFEQDGKLINLPDTIASGVYFVRFKASGFVKTYKIVVQ